MIRITDYSIGSIAERIYNRVENVPTYLSGTPLNDIVDEARIYAEEFTCLNIDPNCIPQKFVPALTCLGQAALQNNMGLEGTDKKKIKLEDFEVSTGGDSNLLKTAEFWQKQGEDKLKAIGKCIRFSRVIGGC